MTDKAGESGKTVAVNAAASPATAALSRRALLRGATIAAPTILTLYSGAALARSSNLIGAAPSSTAENNKYRCLDTSSVYQTEKRYVYDLGDNPMAHVTRISADKKYFKVARDENGERDVDRVDGQKMCADGGWYVRKDHNGFSKVNVKRGVMVSATAMNSFSNDITYTDV
jgi:hypothetical protein